jgi:sensor histidine kinase YesM
VTLEQEMNVVRSFLDIYSVRMGNRLEYTIDVPPDLKMLPIPPLLIQPLVENAVKHGLEPKVTGGRIALHAVRSGSTVRITVADSGVGIQQKAKGRGIGLENVRKRLRLLFGEQGRLLFEENEPAGVKVTIEVPYDAR